MIYRRSLRLSFPFYYNVDAFLLRLAREQRKNMTPAEKKLWQRIRGMRLGMKFRRQHPINRFIADFYCHEARLVVEIDGGYHDEEEQQKYDAGRTKELEEFDIRVIRFTNAEVEENLAGVVMRIKNSLPHPPAPSPQREGE
ncbi:MAG: endonuclease domain-containing protein [Bacteroidales bacterium]|nr:endonuclease domain-containing protein [Bacteroidota bacterium]MBL6949975.1 endonuclease domain-containing protein [Bacteroidales bacterium]